MQYSPKLKIAMDEIKTILKKHDIAGFILLHAPGFSEYLNHVSPSYSCAKLEPEQLRFRLKAAEVGGPEKAKQIATDTYNMITHLADMTSKHAVMYIEAKKFLQIQWNAEDFPGSETDHNSQNN